MGVIQEIAPNPAKALEAGILLAQKVPACGPLGMKMTLTSAQLSIDESEAAAFAKLDEPIRRPFLTEDSSRAARPRRSDVPPSTKVSSRRGLARPPRTSP